jgi:hypothetical protein
MEGVRQAAEQLHPVQFANTFVVDGGWDGRLEEALKVGLAGWQGHSKRGWQAFTSTSTHAEIALP